MPNTPKRYRLVIFDAIDDPQELRELVCGVTGMHPTDAVQWLARAPGVWPQPLEEPEVRKLLDGLYEAGVAAEAWRADQFPELSPARTVHRAACLNDGFRIEGLRGEPTHWVPWDRIEMICAGRISAEDEYRKDPMPRWPSTVVAGHPGPGAHEAAAVGPACPRQRVPRDPVCEALIVRRDPRIAFRVVENQMNYAYLGDRLSTRPPRTSRCFWRTSARERMTAYLTPSTRALLKMAEPGECEFANSQALLEYATHRLLWSWYSRDRDAQSSAPGWDQCRSPRPESIRRPTTATTTSKRTTDACEMRSQDLVRADEFIADTLLRAIRRRCEPCDAAAAT